MDRLANQPVMVSGHASAIPSHGGAPMPRALPARVRRARRRSAATSTEFAFVAA